MIQFNLLPDVKMQYIKVERNKRLVMTVSILVSVVALAVFLLLIITVDGLQKKNMNDLNRDIKTASSSLQKTPDLNKILTIQNQLGSLTALHDKKPTASLLFDDLTRVTPSNVTISSLTADFGQNTLSITGNTNTLDQINTYVDTLKFTTYTTSGNSQATKAFSDVVLASFSRNTTTASYTVTLKFDPTLFSNSQTVVLNVPNTVTTRSFTEQPTALFETGGNR